MLARRSDSIVLTSKSLEGDLNKIPTADILAAAGLKPGQAFLVAGGPPCQSFSTAGHRESVADPRGGLFREFLRVVEEARPRFFLMENVKGLLSAAVKHRPIHLRNGDLQPEEQLGSAFQMIVTEFSRIGYSFAYQILDAVNYGSPQFRERLVVIGSRDNEPLFLPAPTHFQRHQDENLRWVTLVAQLNIWKEALAHARRSQAIAQNCWRMSHRAEIGEVCQNGCVKRPWAVPMRLEAERWGFIADFLTMNPRRR